jgi:PAS domain-containing protein
VASRNDDKLRAPLSGGAELGQLSTDFNYMLQQIERRNSALAVARDSLELRVQERTEELQREVIERKRSEQQQRIAYAATRVLAESVDQESAIVDILPIICEGLGYEVAAIWKWDRQADVLRCTHVWQRPGHRLVCSSRQQETRR